MGPGAADAVGGASVGGHLSAKPLRVLAVTNMYPTAEDPAYGAFVASQMRAVQQAGVEVDVEFVNGRRGYREYLRAFTRVRRLARSAKFDVLHAHYGLTGFVAAFQPLPVVVSFCGDDLLGTPNGFGGFTMKSRLARRLSWYAARQATALICKTEELRAALPREIDRRRAHVIPNGVDTAVFRPQDRSIARRHLGLSLQERLILFPSTPTERRKRVDLAQAAVDVLRTEGLAARLWIVQGVQHADMPTYYQAADCLVVTSDWEGSPNVVKEALCCDLAIVSVEVGDVREWAGKSTGIVMVDRTPSSVAAGIRTQLARGRVDGGALRDQLDGMRVARRIVRIYAEAAGRRAPE